MRLEEIALAKAVTAWLADQMLSALQDGAAGEDELWDLGQSNYEWGCAALHSVGVLARTDHGNAWRIAVPSETISEHMDDRLPDGMALRMLLLGLAYQLGFSHGVSVTGAPFRPTGVLLRDVCTNLVACGYAKEHADGTFEFDDAIGPWMVMAGNWSLSDFEPAPEEEVETVLTAIPSDDRQYLSGSIARSSPMFARWFCAHWQQGKWIRNVRNFEPRYDWDICLASGLYQRLQVHPDE